MRKKQEKRRKKNNLKIVYSNFYFFIEKLIFSKFSNAFSHFLFSFWDKRIRLRVFKCKDYLKVKEDYHRIRYNLYIKSESIKTQLDDIYSFVRLYRSNVINFILLTIALITNPPFRGFVLPVICALFAVGSYLAWRKHQVRLYEQTIYADKATERDFISFYSPQTEKALAVAYSAHSGQIRKLAHNVPACVHLYHVGIILARSGFSEEVVTAGILHDLLEDTSWTGEQIETEFGIRIASIVQQVSEDKSLVWEERKRQYIERIKNADTAVKAVSAVDKIHNLYSIYDALKEGVDVWGRFKRGRAESLRFYNDALHAIGHNWSHKLLNEYSYILRAVEAL